MTSTYQDSSLEAARTAGTTGCKTRISQTSSVGSAASVQSRKSVYWLAVSRCTNVRSRARACLP
jgi:hypothetical protein